MAPTNDYLRELCELLIDSRLGYMDAAVRAKDARLRELLADMGSGRTALINNLGIMLRAREAAVPAKGTLKGTLHRTWMATRDLFSGAEDVVMISECHRGESYLIGKYDGALRRSDQPGDVRALLAGQREELMANLIEIRTLDSALSDA